MIPLPRRMRLVAIVGFGAAGLAPVRGEDPPPATNEAPVHPQAVVIVEGQVFDGRGSGIEGVKIVASRKRENAELEYLNTATTNETGDFKIMAAERVQGTVVVEMKKWGYKDFSKELTLTPSELPPYLDVQLNGAVVAFGVITDATSGAPVAGARVAIESGFEDWSALSEADGKFSIGGLLPGPGMVIVLADGYGRVRHPVARFEDFGELHIQLRPERVVHIQTVDEEGRPVADVGVECVTVDPDDYRTETTDEKGTLTLRGIAADATELKLRVQQDGYVSSVGFDRQIALPADQKESHHTLTLVAAGSVSGVITEASSGKLIYGARVIVGDGFDDGLPRAWSEFDGAYQIVGVPPGSQPVTVHLRGYAPALAEAVVEAGQDAHVDFALTAGTTVAGVVVDEEGKPIPQAYIACHEWRSHTTLALQALTDDDGRFTIDSAPADEFVVSIDGKGYASLEDQTVHGGKTDYRFVLPAAGGGGATTLWPKLKVGEPAPPLELVTLEGKALTLADLKGKWVLLDFWATWCLPCRQQVPHLQAVHKAYGARQDFVMISISLDDDQQALRKFIQANSLDWNEVFGEKGGARKAADAYGAGAIPLVVILNPQGHIEAVDPQGPTLKETVGRFLEDQKPKE